MTSTIQGWDPQAAAFPAASLCPWPGCAAPVQMALGDGVIDRCGTCGRVFVHGRVHTNAGSRDLRLTSRPTAAFCTLTGRPLTAWNPATWAEAGGGPERTSCQRDPLGRVFGAPRPQRELRLEPGPVGEPVRGADGGVSEAISSVVVTLGQVVALTNRGNMAAFDSRSLERVDKGELAWPDELPPDPTILGRHLRFPPVFRGPLGMCAASHMAVFYDLSFLSGRRRGPVSPGPMVRPTPGCSFFGAPLSVDGPAGPLACVLEGRWDRVREDWEGAPTLRFFSLGAADTGTEVAQVEARDLARMPAFCRATGHLIWVSRRGWIYLLDLAGLGEGKPVEHMPDPMLSLKVREPELLAVDSGRSDRLELWLSGSSKGGVGAVYRTDLSALLASPTAAWSWSQPRRVGASGEQHGLAVGVSSISTTNAVRDLVALSTQDGVYQFAKTLDGTFPAITGAAGQGIAGSHDPPLLCGAGLIVRLQGKLRLTSRHTQWSQEPGTSECQLPGAYRERQGMALYGRRLFVGVEDRVRAFDLEPKDLFP